MTRPIHHPSLRGSAFKKRWPFGKLPPIVVLFLGVVWLLIIIEWNLLQRTNAVGNDEAVLPALAAEGGGSTNGQVAIRKESTKKENDLVKQTANNTLEIKDEDLAMELSSQKDILLKSDAYQIGPFCGGCRSLKMEHLMRGMHQERCGILIDKITKEVSNRTPLQAAILVNQNYTDCVSCLECSDHDKKYWRYDSVGPVILNAKTHYLHSIDEKHRIPTSILTDPKQNLTHYFASLNKQNQAPKQYLFEYNPSIVPWQSNSSSSNNNHNEAVYLVSYRVATTQGCFPVETTLQMIGGEWESDRIPQKKDYLGLALLREDLSVVDEAIIDFPRPFRKREDFRLFILHHQLFVATYCKLTPMWVYHKDDERTYKETEFDGKPVENWKANNVFPSNLRVRIGSDITQCAKEPSDNKHAKNLNYFVNKQGETMVELFPLGPHVVRPLFRVLNASAPVPGREDDISNDYMPSPSFYTLEEPLLAQEYNFFEAPFTQDRGGACCIEITDPQQLSKKLWLGVSHAKTPHARRNLAGKLKSNQYLSRWYAFEQDDPFKVVAVSGYFCLSSLPGSAAMHAEAIKANPLMSHAAATAQWTLGRITISCPVIHFVTGMTEKVSDNSKLIIAYGVGDCSSWFVEVTKAQVVELLFDGPKA